MQTASREALQATRGRLVPAATEADAEGRRRLADDLWAMAVFFAHEPGLRRVVADAAQPVEAREGVVEALFASRVTAPALAVLRAAVGQRWSLPSDLVDALELLSLDADLVGAEQHGELETLEDELFRFLRTVEAAPDLARILTDSTANESAKKHLVHDLLAEKALTTTVRFAERAASGLGGRGFEASLQRMVELVAVARGREVAYVKIASHLSSEQQEHLTARLSEMYGRPLSLKVQLEPELLGGVVVNVGDDLYDGSVARRLEQARTALAT
jgi:F-type H+-transporting ATPase subunit delta